MMRARSIVTAKTVRRTSSLDPLPRCLSTSMEGLPMETTSFAQCAPLPSFPHSRALSRERLEGVDYRTLQKLATHLRIPGRLLRNEVIDKILDAQNDSLHNPYIVEPAVDSAEVPQHGAVDKTQTFVTPAFFKNLEHLETKFIARAIGVDPRVLSKTDLVRAMCDAKTLTLARAEELLDTVPHNFRVRRKNSIFDDKEFFAVSRAPLTAPSSSSSLTAPADEARKLAFHADDPSYKAFRQFLKMKDELDAISKNVKRTTAASEGEQTDQSTAVSPAEAPTESERARVALTYSVPEAERFLTHLQDERVVAGQTSPSPETLALYLAIADDALRLYAQQSLEHPQSNHPQEEESETSQRPARLVRISRNYELPTVVHQAMVRVKTARDTRKRPLTVVGDVAANFPNLLHVMSESVGGFPSADNPFVFMGKLLSLPALADEEEKNSSSSAVCVSAETTAQQTLSGLKCLFALLFLKLTIPSAVHILRSDEMMSALLRKMDENANNSSQGPSAEQAAMEELFSKVHRLLEQLPTAAIVDDAAFISHNGLGHLTSKMTVEDIEHSVLDDEVLKELVHAEQADTDRLSGFIRRNRMEIIVRASGQYLPTGFAEDKEHHLVSLYSCPHITGDAECAQRQERDAGVQSGFNTGAVLRFDKARIKDYRVLTFLSRLDETSDDDDFFDFF